MIIYLLCICAVYVKVRSVSYKNNEFCDFKSAIKSDGNPFDPLWIIFHFHIFRLHCVLSYLPNCCLYLHTKIYCTNVTFGRNLCIPCCHIETNPTLSSKLYTNHLCWFFFDIDRTEACSNFDLKQHDFFLLLICKCVNALHL